jgi:hypothetical protein
MWICLWMAMAGRCKLRQDLIVCFIEKQAYECDNLNRDDGKFISWVLPENGVISAALLSIISQHAINALDRAKVIFIVYIMLVRHLFCVIFSATTSICQANHHIKC